jgi:AraC family transcriptional regulator
MSEALLQIQQAIDLIEGRLFESVRLPELARAAGCSPWHFLRVFAAFTGHTPGGYARKRRIAETCRRLAETDQPIVDIALECGFESQATFTRAFTRHVGLSPGRFRAQCVLSPAHLFAPLDPAALLARRRWEEEMQPKLLRRPAFDVVGMAGHFTPSTNTRIPELWARFARRMPEVQHRRGICTFGLCVDPDPGASGDGAFKYVAAVEVERGDDVPEGMVSVHVPENRYAVFTHRGHVSQLGATVKHVFDTWLAAQPVRRVPAPDFELYDERFDPMTGDGEVDIYVPIADD